MQLTSELEEFPKQSGLLAQDMVSFWHSLHDIPELIDEELNGSVLSAEADLKYWASCLLEFPGLCEVVFYIVALT
ncbi:hypothetical protein FRC02_008078 [Tulasnella sp. 418]|nr:hypothetical protein FRC02_008078 [Tulasnella sp. 418]